MILHRKRLKPDLITSGSRESNLNAIRSTFGEITKYQTRRRPLFLIN